LQPTAPEISFAPKLPERVQPKGYYAMVPADAFPVKLNKEGTLYEVGTHGSFTADMTEWTQGLPRIFNSLQPEYNAMRYPCNVEYNGSPLYIYYFLNSRSNEAEVVFGSENGTIYNSAKIMSALNIVHLPLFRYGNRNYIALVKVLDRFILLPQNFCRWSLLLEEKADARPQQQRAQMPPPFIQQPLVMLPAPMGWSPAFFGPPQPIMALPPSSLYYSNTNGSRLPQSSAARAGQAALIGCVGVPSEWGRSQHQIPHQRDSLTFHKLL